jgi:cellulose synthase/poly-beta-1,6-N-acetylglucosamine synthase-like glycosyltransferase
MSVETSSRPFSRRQTGVQPSAHDDFGFNQTKTASAIDARSLERDAGGKPVSPFPHVPHAARATWGHHEAGHSSSGRRLEALPAELTFLSAYGAPPSLLIEAAAVARRQAITPDAALLATGAVTEAFYYQCLARHLGVAFVSGAAELGPGVRYPHSIHAGVAPLSGDGPRWLAAPRGEMLATLLRRRHCGEAMSETLAIAAPAHLSRLVRAAAAPAIAREASLALADRDPALSAKSGVSSGQCWAAAAIVAALALMCALAPDFGLPTLTIAVSCVFLAALCLRLFAGAASCDGGEVRPNAPVADRLLPAYSIVVALHREARVVRQLVSALDAIDYPRGKLDIKLVIEDNDIATFRALAALKLPPRYEVIVAPNGWPRTKPRALNVALPLLRGEFVAVFDAEDAPAPRQLRDAAERFLRAPCDIACLQAQLCIDNAEDSWLTRLFAIEYAALFEVVLRGLASLRLPLPLGGSSNHFRTGVLREICAWDAWNVTEDADIGLRLARLGYRCETLQSTTEEEAPAFFSTWLTQRMRWSKGWTQTFITLSRDPARLISEVGWSGAGVLGLMMTNLVAAPLLWPVLSAALVYHLASAGLPRPESVLIIVETTLWLSVAIFGAGSALWLTLLGMKRRKLLGLWLVLPLLPLYYLLMSLAAWAALYDLAVRPFHWRKTEHGLARTRRRARGTEAEPSHAVARAALARQKPL